MVVSVSSMGGNQIDINGLDCDQFARVVTKQHYSRVNQTTLDGHDYDQ